MIMGGPPGTAGSMASLGSLIPEVHTTADDPALSSSGFKTMYQPGAAKVRRVGQHRLEKLKIDQRQARRQKLLLKHGAASARIRGRYASLCAIAEAAPARPGPLPALSPRGDAGSRSLRNKKKKKDAAQECANGGEDSKASVATRGPDEEG